MTRLNLARVNLKNYTIFFLLACVNEGAPGGGCSIMVIRAQIFKKNAQIFFFHAQAKMLSVKIIIRLKCSDKNICSYEKATF